MCDMSITMEFELLPNEIIIECFEYLNAPAICYSFDQLNYRFYKLIRSILFHVKFRIVNKLTFMRFCQKMLSNPERKHQIISLQLSNIRFRQSEIFLSEFSFENFSQLRSLTLNGYIVDNTFHEVISMLSSLKNLCCVHVSISTSRACQILYRLSKAKLKILLPDFCCDLTGLEQTMTITSVKIDSICAERLCHLYEYTPLVKYLDIKELQPLRSMEYQHNSSKLAICLKQLRIGISLNNSFEDFERFFKQTPNLKTLIVFGQICNDMIDADHWQSLITSTLHHLDVFLFAFTLRSVFKCNDTLDKIQKFQTDFWHKQHHWYTDYECDYHSTVIYTIPYILTRYTIRLDTNKYSNSLISSDVFKNVMHLDVPINIIKGNCQYYFRNVESLTLTNTWSCYNKFGKSKSEIQLIPSLKMIMNLFNIRHLSMWCYFKMELSFVILEILKETPQLSSLDFNMDFLISLMSNDELCEYLNKMIKILRIDRYRNDKVIKYDQIALFCKTFSNLEYLRCWINSSEHFLFLLQILSKLSEIRFSYASNTFPDDMDSWLKDNALKLNNNCVFVYSGITKFYNI